MTKKLLSLVSLIEKKDRRIVYTDFEDEMGEETPGSKQELPRSTKSMPA